MKGLKALKQNNKGAGVVTVIVALSFLATLGLLIMAISYTSSEMKSSERTGREVAYNANGVVEQLRSGAELAVSDSINDCYTTVMTNYSFYRNDIEKMFDRSFCNSLQDWSPYYVDVNGVKQYYKSYDVDDKTASISKNDGIKLFCGDTESYYVNGSEHYTVLTGYNINALKKFIKAGFGGEPVVSCLGADGEVAEDGIGVAIWDYNSEKDPSNEAITIKTPKSVTLKDIQVSYRKLLRTVKISTDIVIDFPDLGFVYNEETAGSRFTEFAVISMDEFEQQTGHIYIDGKAYAKKINISGKTHNHQLDLLPGGLLIVPDEVVVNGNNSDSRTSEQNSYLSTLESESAEAAALDFDSALRIESGTLWANNIKVMRNAIVSLYRANVKNDLNLAESGASALIKDEYYGFGSSESDPTQSSAILAQGFENGSNSSTKLVLQGAKVTLAGYSFINVIDPESGALNGSVKMGQSMAATEDQTAYLVPLEMLNYNDDEFEIKVDTNPELFSADPDNGYNTSQEVYEAFCNQLANKSVVYKGEAKSFAPRQRVLWKINDIEMTPADYGITIKPLAKNYSGYTVGYFFMEFNDTNERSAIENANKFFVDYFENNTNKVRNYLDQYISLTDASSYFGYVGNIYPPILNVITNKWILKQDYLNIAAISSRIEQKNSAFDNLCITLNEGYGPEKAFDEELGTDDEKEIRSNAVDPFDYYVRKIDDSGTLKYVVDYAVENSGENQIWFNDDDGKVVALVTNAPFTYTSDYPDLCLIISTSDVTVTADFTGLIMCKGKINANASEITLTADSDAVNAAMSATTTYDKSTYGFDPELDEDGNVLPKAAMPYEFLYYAYTPPTEKTNIDEGSYWDVGTLVYFDKWKRN